MHWYLFTMISVQLENALRLNLVEGIPNLSKFNNDTEAATRDVLLRPATLLKKRLWQLFSSEFYEICKNIFFTEYLWTPASGDMSLL